MSKITAAFALTFLFYSTAQGSPDPELTWFKETYDESRTAFTEIIGRLQKRFGNLERGALQVPSATDKDLTIDYAYLPAQASPQGLVIVTSGVHGAEGFAGSGVLRFIASDIVGAGKADTQNTGYLFIHAVNPYGFRYGRRVSENNVDLNRNFGTGDEHFKRKNPAYVGMQKVLNPDGPASASWPAHFKLVAKGAREAAKIGMGGMIQAVGVGQYEVPQGIMFGGKDFEPQQRLLQPLFLKKSQPYGKVLILDLHTGYGRRGYMHLLPNPPENDAERERMKKVFGNYPIETAGDGGDFFSSDGDYSTYVSRLLTSKGKTTVPMLIEFGTVDSQTYRGSLKTLTRLIRENQMHWHDAVSKTAETNIRRNFRELFFPKNLQWRKKLIRDTQEHLPTFLKNFAQL